MGVKAELRRRVGEMTAAPDQWVTEGIGVGRCEPTHTAVYAAACLYTARLRYCRTASVRITAADMARIDSGSAIAAGPAPFIRIAREIVTK